MTDDAMHLNRQEIVTSNEKKKANRKVKKYKHRIVRNLKRYIKGWKKDIEKGKKN